VSEDRPVARIALPTVLREGAPAAVLAALPGARAVGGAVRDTLAGLAVQDVDVAAPYPPEEISNRLRAAGLRVFETGLAHGTVTVVLDHQPVEVTALRRDVVTDGRHAEVAWTTDWREDAARRDFTINAMSLAPDGSLYDYFGGREDLKRGVVRFVGDPATRLREDYLRVLRFFRFHTRYGRGEPDAAAVAAIREAVPGLARLSVERVWMELKRILAAPDPVPAVALMFNTEVLAAILPEATPPQLAALQGLIEARVPADPVLRLVVLLPPATAGRGEGIGDRLKLSRDEKDGLVWLHDMVASRPNVPGATSLAGARRWLADRGDPDTALKEAWLAQARDGRDHSALRDWISATPFPGFPLLGRDAVALGVQPGPQIGALLSGVRQWWLDGGCTADRDACLAELNRLVASHNNNGGADPGG